MRLGKKIVSTLLAASLLAGLVAMPAMAATRKKITSISVEVESNVVPDTRYGEEEIDVTVRGDKFSFESYEITNHGFMWEDNMVPEITLTFVAEDGYYFSLTKASEVKLDGATYVKASVQNSRTELLLQVKLPSLAESVGAIESVQMNTDGYAAWNEVKGAGSYQVRLYRNGTLVGNTEFATTDLYYNFKERITRAGSYSCRVRAVNKVNEEKKSEWVDSNTVNITDEQVARIRAGEVGGAPVQNAGEWKSDGTGQWYAHSDGTYTQNNWEEIDGEWYFFDENGYMKTGWIEWNGNRYFLANSGKMMRNTTTPDGTIVDGEGKPKTGN